jgi:hypothetical protein
VSLHGYGARRAVYGSRFAQHADTGPFHYETRFVGGTWEWEITETLKGKIGSGRAATLDHAKAAIIVETGRKPDEWKDIGPDLDSQEHEGRGFPRLFVPLVSIRMNRTPSRRNLAWLWQHSFKTKLFPRTSLRAASASKSPWRAGLRVSGGVAWIIATAASTVISLGSPFMLVTAVNHYPRLVAQALGVVPARLPAK